MSQWQSRNQIENTQASVKKEYKMKAREIALLGLLAALLPGSANASIQTFGYTGAMQSFVVPSGVISLTIEAWGAQGGDGHYQAEGYQPGGRGGYVTGTLEVVPGDVLYVVVGGQGQRSSVSPAAGGFNGGGNGYNYDNTFWTVAGGGGASDVRLGGTSLLDRVVVAGGGGGGGGSGSGGNGAGGDGGGVSGIAGHWSGLNGAGQSTPDTVRHGRGGTQSAGGAGGIDPLFGFSGSPGTLGFGGDASTGPNSLAGGGGGGYYGGGGGGYHGGAGGGGSSYIGGLSDARTITGPRTGDGLIQFAYVDGVVPEPLSAIVWVCLIAGVATIRSLIRCD